MMCDMIFDGIPCIIFYEMIEKKYLEYELLYKRILILGIHWVNDILTNAQYPSLYLFTIMCDGILGGISSVI